MSYAIAAVANGLYGYLEWAVQQLIPTEDSDLDSILRWANVFLEIPQKPATQATGSIVFGGTDTTLIPDGTQVTSRDGVVYQTVGNFSIQGTFVLAAGEAVEPGKNGNLASGAALFLNTPIAGIDSEATVASPFTGGADIEDRLDVLDRLLTRMKTPPRGGSAGDYESWALEVSGVDRAYEYANVPNGAFVTVVVVDDDEADFVPGAAMLTAVQDNIDAKRPIAMGGAVVRGPDQYTLSCYWAGVPDDPVIRTSLETAVNDWVRANTEPGKTISQSEIENAGQTASGVPSGITLTIPISDVVMTSPYMMIDVVNHVYL
jgi:uncharacterized phage protein gp47/JayE